MDHRSILNDFERGEHRIVFGTSGIGAQNGKFYMSFMQNQAPGKKKK